MKLVVDMNLSPDWVAFLVQADWKAVHWSNVGNPRAADSEIMTWAKQNSHVVFTHDLDFGTILALTQVIGKLVVSALKQFQPALEKGALIILDEATVRARILPLKN